MTAPIKLFLVLWKHLRFIISLFFQNLDVENLMSAIPDIIADECVHFICELLFWIAFQLIVKWLCKNGIILSPPVAKKQWFLVVRAFIARITGRIKKSDSNCGEAIENQKTVTPSPIANYNGDNGSCFEDSELKTGSHTQQFILNTDCPPVDQKAVNCNPSDESEADSNTKPEQGKLISMTINGEVQTVNIEVSHSRIYLTLILDENQ